MPHTKAPSHFNTNTCAHTTTDRRPRPNLAEGIRSTIILARKTSAFRRKEKLVGDSPRRKDKPVNTGKPRTCKKSVLSQMLAQEDTDTDRAARNHRDSPLLRFPAEPRIRVYTMVPQPECVLDRSRYLNAFDITLELRSCCTLTPPINSQPWIEGQSMTLLPVTCRQLYEETHALLSAEHLRVHR